MHSAHRGCAIQRMERQLFCMSAAATHAIQVVHTNHACMSSIRASVSASVLSCPSKKWHKVREVIEAIDQSPSHHVVYLL